MHPPGLGISPRAAHALLRWIAAILATLPVATPAHAQSSDEISVGIVQYGLGRSTRPGDWTGIQVNLLDSAPQQREVILRIAVRDPDGDQAQYDRVVTANPGVEQSFWVYARLPFNAANDPPPILAFEALPSNDAATGYRAGRLLGRYDPQPGDPGITLTPSLAIGAVLGPYPAGLEQYAYTASASLPAVPLGHELTRLATDLDVRRLPDRWQGLASTQFLAWTESTTRLTEPTALTPEQARAIRRWVEFGGHLIITLPPAGDPWFATTHPLSDLLPRITRPLRRDGFDLNTIRPLLTDRPDTPLPTNAVIHTFEPAPDASSLDAQRVLESPDGACIAIRRTVGLGAVTVIGVDLTAGPLRRYNLPDADALWHRILGRRADLRRADELTEQERSDAASRSTVDFDHDISSAIDSTGRAVQGILFGLIVFITYWLVAGPVGYYLLKQRALHQHAWVAFVACSAAFTALAWAGATALRPKRVAVTHLTILDTVQQADQPAPAIRVRSWFSVILPSYGRSTVALTPPTDDPLAERSSDLLAPWDPPASATSWNKGFPDNTGYTVDARFPDQLTVPTRATVKQFRADLSTTTDWSLPTIRRDPARIDAPRIERNAASLTGEVIHELPAPLTNVRIFLSQGQAPIRTPGQPNRGEPTTRTLVLAPRFQDNLWLPNQPLDLAAATAPEAIRDAIRFDYFATAVRDGTNLTSINPTAGRPLTDRLIAARFLSNFAPPNYRDDRDTVANRLARRFSTHTLDLGHWLTTPCIIIVGFIETDPRDAEPANLPFPLYVNGNPAPASGLTMVTWICPLDDTPPDWPYQLAPQAQDPADQPAPSQADDTDTDPTTDD